MQTESQTESPREIDARLAELYVQEQSIRQRIELSEHSALVHAGAAFYYLGRRRVTDMTVAQAEEILAADMAARPDDGTDFGYTLIRRGGSIGQIRRTVANLAQHRAALAETLGARDDLESRYTGWSRFFLVTSSKGHIHSSMGCSTCRPTTRYGWLPELSGRTEADAVSELGPALCSVCFPSAPVEWTIAEISKAQAAKAAGSAS